MKKKKLPSISKLKTRAENLWKEIAFLRDGNSCQVWKKFPSILVSHTNILQVDHVFSRKDKNLFLSISNSLVICSGCNMNKHYQNKSVHRAVDQIVAKREGLEKFQEMKRINESMKPNVNFSKRWWLEDQIKSLTIVRDNLKAGVFV